ncbi:hypothetical protein MKX73_19840 [Solibacillus sp. FSL W7-1436]
MLRKLHNYFFEEDAEMSRTDMLFGGLFILSVAWAAFVVIMVGVS